MAIDRQGIGLVIVRICLGVFFIFSAFNKLRWLMDSSILSGQLALWMHNVAPGSISQSYLQRFAIPGAAILARLVQRETGSRTAGLAAAGVLAATYFATDTWFDVGRVDSLFVALSIAGLYAARHALRTRGAIVAGLLLGMAVGVADVRTVLVAATVRDGAVRERTER